MQLMHSVLIQTVWNKLVQQKQPLLMLYANESKQFNLLFMCFLSKATSIQMFWQWNHLFSLSLFNSEALNNCASQISPWHMLFSQRTLFSRCEASRNIWKAFQPCQSEVASFGQFIFHVQYKNGNKSMMHHLLFNFSINYFPIEKIGIQTIQICQDAYFGKYKGHMLGCFMAPMSYVKGY